jgi:hypothetical protein
MSPAPWSWDLKFPATIRDKEGYLVAEFPVAGVADLRFCIEAREVAAETGLTPRQLADQRSELLKALQRIVQADDDQTLDGDDIKAARAAIAKAEGASK